MIVFAWKGFPQYAARCVGAFARDTAERICVIATRPKVPIDGMGELCGCPLLWIDDDACLDDILGWLGTEKVTTLVVSGWAVPAFNRLTAHVRQDHGRIICMIDNNLDVDGIRKRFTEMIKGLRFRIGFRGKFDGFLVPGRSGRRLLRFYGVPENRIAEGMYAADGMLFHDGPPLRERPKKILYVGQFIERKNVRRLVQAFVKSAEILSGWTLELYGSGPLREWLQDFAAANNPRLAMRDSHISIYGFLQPEELAEKYRNVRIFCLPSLSEHWGLVVHEAALSGCVLLLGKDVGAAEDMLQPGSNGWTFDPMDLQSLESAFGLAMQMPDERLNEAQSVSLQMARHASVDKFVAGVGQFLRCHGNG